MAENSPIEWTNHTWSPWEGCTKVSPGCDHCYAEGMNRWLRKGANWGPGAPRREYSDQHWAKPLKWDAQAKALVEVLGPGEPVKVFPSVCDPFDNAAPEDGRPRFAHLILGTPHLTWLLLTKRIGNAAAMLAEMFPRGTPANVWLGATVVNQEEVDRDIPKLLATPARVRFLSCEPLLGPVDLGRFIGDSLERACPRCNWRGYGPRGSSCPLCRLGPEDGPLHWVIAGGESGRGARPMHPDWARTLRNQCAAAGVPFLFKQWGQWVPDRQQDAHLAMDLSRPVPNTVRFYKFEADGGEVRSTKVGKKAAGRLLDGVEHNGFPA
jgi:protein gp37